MDIVVYFMAFPIRSRGTEQFESAPGDREDRRDREDLKHPEGREVADRPRTSLGARTGLALPPPVPIPLPGLPKERAHPAKRVCWQSRCACPQSCSGMPLQ